MPHSRANAWRVAQKPYPQNQPAYSVAEAARYLTLPASTLRSWTLGRFWILKRRSRSGLPALSFWNLIEAHVIRSLRAERGVSLKAVREAVDYAERIERIDRLLLSKELRTHAGKLFLDKYGQLIDLPASGQLAMRMLFEEHLKRVEWDEWKFPVRLYPFVSGDTRAIRTIAIDPSIAFGRPVVARAGVSTGAIAGRIDANEPVQEVADDYDLTVEEVEQAVLYERAA